MVLVLGGNLEFLGGTMDSLYCTQRPAALISLLCSMACTQTKHHRKITAESTVAAACSAAFVMMWLCSQDLIAWVKLWLWTKNRSTIDTIGISIAARQVCTERRVEGGRPPSISRLCLSLEHWSDYVMDCKPNSIQAK